MLQAVGVILCIPFVQLSSLSAFSICSPMGIIGDGLMTAQAVGAATVHQTTVPLTRHGGLGRAVSASQLDAGDILYSLTLWYRYAQTLFLSTSSEYLKNTLHGLLNFVVGCVARNCWVPLFDIMALYWTGKRRDW